MLNIKINLYRLNEEEAKAQRISASALNDAEMTEAEHLARDVLAPLAVRQLFIDEGDKVQKINARQLGEIFANCGAVCGGALWFCGSGEEADRLTLADGYRVRAFGRIARGGCFILILENSEEQERAYLVRPEW